jgi:hypothetical protein
VSVPSSGPWVLSFEAVTAAMYAGLLTLDGRKWEGPENLVPVLPIAMDLLSSIPIPTGGMFVPLGIGRGRSAVQEIEMAAAKGFRVVHPANEDSAVRTWTLSDWALELRLDQSAMQAASWVERMSHPGRTRLHVLEDGRAFLAAHFHRLVGQNERGRWRTKGGQLVFVAPKALKSLIARGFDVTDLYVITPSTAVRLGCVTVSADPRPASVPSLIVGIRDFAEQLRSRPEDVRRVKQPTVDSHRSSALLIEVRPMVIADVEAFLMLLNAGLVKFKPGETRLQQGSRWMDLEGQPIIVLPEVEKTLTRWGLPTAGLVVPRLQGGIHAEAALSAGYRLVRGNAETRMMSELTSWLELSHEPVEDLILDPRAAATVLLGRDMGQRMAEIPPDRGGDRTPLPQARLWVLRNYSTFLEGLRRGRIAIAGWPGQWTAGGAPVVMLASGWGEMEAKLRVGQYGMAQLPNRVGGDPLIRVVDTVDVPTLETWISQAPRLPPPSVLPIDVERLPHWLILEHRGRHKPPDLVIGPDL